MTVGSVTDSRDYGTAFCQRRLHVEFVFVAVEIVNVLRDNLTLEVLPGSVPDAIACIDRRLAISGLAAR